MERYARVSAGHIVRFGELTKREIQVLSVLFLSRNGRNDQCNPRRKTIAELSGLALPHISIAIAGLETKGWIMELPGGEFHLFDAADIPAEKVTNSVTSGVTKSIKKSVEKSVNKSVENPEKVTNSVTSGITKSVSKVIDSVTKNYQNGNSRIYTEQKREQKKNRQAAKRAHPLKFSKPVRIPDPFELTDEMLSWIDAEVPGLRVAEAMTGFVEYWTNGRGKKATKLNWLLTWQKGMRNAKKWQDRDDAAAANARSGAIDEKIDPNCPNCEGSGREFVNDYSVPCSRCRTAAEKAYWRNKR